MSIENRDLRPGQTLIAKYKGKEHRASVVAGKEGRVAYRLKDGREFTSPSAAGSAVMGGVACNGWRWWSVDGAETKKPAKAAKKAASKTKAAAKPKGKKGRKVAGGGNGEPEVPVEKPVNCGDCGQAFSTSHEAGDHMRDEHGSLEAAGSGGR